MNNGYKRNRYSSYKSGRYTSSSYSRYKYKKSRRKTPQRAKFVIVKILLVVCVIALLCGFVMLFSLIVKNCSCEDCMKNMPTFPTRSTEVTTVATTENVTEKESKPKKKKPEQAQKTESAEFTVPKISDNGSAGEVFGDFYIWNDMIFKAFSGKTDDASGYAQAINSVNTTLGEDIDVSAMLVPTHIEMGLPQRLKNSNNGIKTQSQADYIRKAYSDFDMSINAINCYNLLAENCGDYNYFDTDYHWTARGAYQGYSAFAKANSLKPVSLDSLERKVVPDFYGSYQAFYRDFGIDYESIEYWDYSDKYSVSIEMTNYAGEIEDAYSCFYTGEADVNDKYIVFLQGSYPLQAISSTSKEATEDKICIVHQGFANSIVSYFTYNYKEVYSINLDNWDGNLKDFCQTRGIKKVLFINDVASSADKDTVSQIKKIAY